MIRTLLDLLHPTDGEAQIFGLDSRRDSLAIRVRLGNLRGSYATDGSRWFEVHLRPTGDGGTRLLTTGWVRSNPRWLTEAVDWLVWDPAHWVMQIKQFRELGRRAESAAAATYAKETVLA